MKKKNNWIVVTDFDGTLTQKDVGNELCRIYAEEKYSQLQKLYKEKKLSLRAYQKQMWENFPLTKSQFMEESARLGSLRKGVNEFLERCLRLEVPVYIASCGIDTYIQSVIQGHLSESSRAAILETKSNKALYTEDGQFLEIECPEKSDHPNALPLHKGKWAQKLAEKHDGAKTMCLGNGNSDKSFIGHCDLLFATEKFATHCENEKIEHIYFDDFRKLYQFNF